MQLELERQEEAKLRDGNKQQKIRVAAESDESRFYDQYPRRDRASPAYDEPKTPPQRESFEQRSTPIGIENEDGKNFRSENYPPKSTEKPKSYDEDELRNRTPSNKIKEYESSGFNWKTPERQNRRFMGNVKEMFDGRCEEEKIAEQKKKEMYAAELRKFETLTD